MFVRIQFSQEIPQILLQRENVCLCINCHFFTKLSSAELALPQLLSLENSKGTSFKEGKLEDKSGHCKVCDVMVVWYYAVKAIKFQKFENKGKTNLGTHNLGFCSNAGVISYPLV